MRPLPAFHFKALGTVLAAVVIAACSHTHKSGAHRYQDLKFQPPQRIDDCGEGLSIDRFQIDLGVRIGSDNQITLEYAFKGRTFFAGNIVTILVPKTEHGSRLSSIIAVRYDVDKMMQLPSVSYELDSLKPHDNDVFTKDLANGYLIFWQSPDGGADQGVVFRKGAWQPATYREIASYGPITRMPYSPPVAIEGDPITGVNISVEPRARQGKVLKRGKEIGTILFPSQPGSPLGFFGNTGRMLLWARGASGNGEQLPVKHQRHSYLVNLYSGDTCRVSRRLNGEGNHVFRTATTIVVLSAVRKPGSSMSKYGSGTAGAAPLRDTFGGVTGLVIRDSP